MKWENRNASPTPVHESMKLGLDCSGGILTRSGNLPGYFLTLQLTASTSLDATLEECKRDFLAILIPMLEKNLAEVRRLAEEDAT